MQISGKSYLLIAVLIFAAANSVTRKLTELGAENLIDGRNPISFCNVLFVGNLCALIALIAIYRQEWNFRQLRQLNHQDWLGLMGVAVLSGALAPALIFTALENTNVTNVILVSRLEIPLTLILSIWILKARVNSWVITGAIISFTGIIFTIILQNPAEKTLNMAGDFRLGFGEILAALGAIAFASANIISKLSLRQISLGIFTIFRTGVGTIIFFIVVVILFSFNHFIDVFSPLVWKWMAIYSIIIVVGGQIFWFQGLKLTTAADVSLANSFNPIASILLAYLILGEIPTKGQYIGGIFIILGIIIHQIGVLKQSLTITSTSTAKNLENEGGFKGI